MKKTVRFGVIGCGLMGREFAGAAARWSQLSEDIPRPEIVGVADPDPGAREWFTGNFPGVRISTADYRGLLSDPGIDAIYAAVPHALHERVYIDVIEAGKHLLGEKPFGIDKAANDRILMALARHPEVTVRCSSEFPYYPGCQELIRRIREHEFGKIIEVRSSFCHSSDMDPEKPINWKRKVELNGAYGCMGDLGIHVEHVPFRMGWIPENVFAKLSNIVTERPDGKGGRAPCLTWDNALLISDVRDADGGTFPLLMRTMRLAPGATNSWSLEVLGMRSSARFTTDDPNAFFYTDSWGREQAWCRIGVGYKPMIPTVTGGIFEFGFPDAILQMWAAFMTELGGGTPSFGVLRPEETRLSHRLQTAALVSQREGRVVRLSEI